MSPKLAPSWLHVGPCWAKLAPSWPQVGPKLAHVGPTWLKLAQVGPKLAPRWPQVGPCWLMLAPSWPHDGPSPKVSPRLAKASTKALPLRAGPSKIGLAWQRRYEGLSMGFFNVLSRCYLLVVLSWWCIFHEFFHEGTLFLDRSWTILGSLGAFLGCS